MVHMDCGWIKNGAEVLYHGKHASPELKAEYLAVFKDFQTGENLKKTEDKTLKESLYRQMEVHALQYFVTRAQDIVGNGVLVVPVMFDARKSPWHGLTGDRVMVVTPPNSLTTEQMANDIKELLRDRKAELVVDLDHRRMYVTSVDFHAELAGEVNVKKVLLYGQNKQTAEALEKAIKSLTNVPVVIVGHSKEKSKLH